LTQVNKTLNKTVMNALFWQNLQGKTGSYARKWRKMAISIEGRR